MGTGCFYSGGPTYGTGVAAVGRCLPSEGSSAAGRKLKKKAGCYKDYFKQLEKPEAQLYSFNSYR